jgi:hypothetical protein
MFFKNRIAFIPPLAEAGVFCDDYDKGDKYFEFTGA